MSELIERYGDYPMPEECEDAGVREPPEKMPMMNMQEQQTMSHYPSWVWDQEMPPHRRVSPLVREFEEKGGNHRVTIPGLGVLTVGPSGWAVFGV